MLSLPSNVPNEGRAPLLRASLSIGLLGGNSRCSTCHCPVVSNVPDTSSEGFSFHLRLMGIPVARQNEIDRAYRALVGHTSAWSDQRCVPSQSHDRFRVLSHFAQRSEA